MLNKKIVYIAGYSRSGSTILDVILSSHSNIFSTGELGYLFDDWLDGTRTCTCQQIYELCPFWKNFKMPIGVDFKEAQHIIRQVESRKNLNLLINNKIAFEKIEKYKTVQTSLYNYIFETSGKKIIIDSSKSARDMAGRFYALHKYTDLDIYVIHLIKDGLSIVESYVNKGRNWALEGYGKNDRFLAARSALGWLLANKIACRLGKKLSGTKYLRIKYEDLTRNPEETFNRIGNFINEDLSEVLSLVQAGHAFRAEHNVGGNRLRLEKEIKFKPYLGIKTNLNLSLKDRLTFKLIAGKLNKSFGYDSVREILCKKIY